MKIRLMGVLFFLVLVWQISPFPTNYAAAAASSCQQGSTLINGTCLVVTPGICPPKAKVMADGTCDFGPADVSCPKGTKEQGKYCVANVTCPPGGSLKKSRCEMQKAACPPGSEMGMDGVYCMMPSKESKCPSGLTKTTTIGTSNSFCISEGTCPPGSSLSGGWCWATPTCPSGTALNPVTPTWEERPPKDMCASLLIAPDGTYCPNGGKIDRASRTCWSNSSCPTGYKDRVVNPSNKNETPMRVCSK